MKTGPNGISDIATTGDSMIEREVCETIIEHLNPATGAVLTREKSNCEMIHSEGGKASEGLMATTLQALSIVVGLISIGMGM